MRCPEVSMGGVEEGGVSWSHWILRGKEFVGLI